MSGQAWAVLVNAEEQFGLYPAHLPPPDGWRARGCVGTEQECRAFVDEHWVDLRPAGLRRATGSARPGEERRGTPRADGVHR
jgi:MbtH protein